MARRVNVQSCPQVHRRDYSKNPKARGPCGHPPLLTRNTAAFLPGVPRVRSPASSVRRSTRTSCRPSRIASFPSLGGTAAAPCASFLQPQHATNCGPGIVHRNPQPDLSTETTGSPRFLEDLTMNVPCSSTPAGPLRSATAALRYCLPPLQRRRLPRSVQFRSSITRPAHSLSTLRRVSYPTAAQDSLPDGWPAFPGGSWLPAGSQRKVSGHSIPLPQASPGAL
jgi:hypothetical protein